MPHALAELVLQLSWGPVRDAQHEVEVLGLSQARLHQAYRIGQAPGVQPLADLVRPVQGRARSTGLIE